MTVLVPYLVERVNSTAFRRLYYGGGKHCCIYCTEGVAESVNVITSKKK